MKEISITDIDGVLIGHAQDYDGMTGCTAIICPDGAQAGVEVRGGGPASRETELLDPVKNCQAIHCVMLSGGSAYGLAAGDGAMQWLEEKGIGYQLGDIIVPLVCGASIFDLMKASSVTAITARARERRSENSQERRTRRKQDSAYSRRRSTESNAERSQL